MEGIGLWGHVLQGYVSYLASFPCFPVAMAEGVAQPCCMAMVVAHIGLTYHKPRVKARRLERSLRSHETEGPFSLKLLEANCIRYFCPCCRKLPYCPDKKKRKLLELKDSFSILNTEKMPAI